MHKQEILTLVKSALESGTISHEDILGVSEELHAQQSTPEARVFAGRRRFTPSSILYLIGGLIVIVGVATFVYNFWDDLSGVVRILVTLGLSIAAYTTGILLRDNEDLSGVATVMQFIGGVLAPIGLTVVLDQMGIDMTLGWSTAVSVALFFVYGASFVLFRSTVFALFTLIFGISSLYTGVAYSIDITGQGYLADVIYKYLTLALGAGLIFLGNAIETGPQRVLRGLLYWLGAFGVYAALLSLGGYKPNQSYIWEWLSVATAIGGLYLASVTQNRSLLKATTLFVFILIGKFTAEYFADSLGWPIALIIGGLVIIAAGFGIVRFSKNISKTA